MSREQLTELLETLEAVEQRQKFRKLDYYKPYPKQKQFHDLGATKRERLLMAANQVGKTYSAAAEIAIHATGEYPEWWTGRRFTKPLKIWIGGESSLLVREAPQTLLCGTPGVEADLGIGLIPKSSFLGRPSLARGVTDAFDTIQVHHKTDGNEDGISTIAFKSYEQGRTKWQAGTVDIVWCDEEPPEDVYEEILARITATNGIVLVTFTPLKGRTKVVIRYTNEPSPDRCVVGMTIDEAPHITPEMKAKAIAGYSRHMRDARTKGIPLLGSGAIFTEPEENITETGIRDIPQYWAKLWAIDFGIGIDHAFAAALLLWDRDKDVVHLHHTIRMVGALPIQHAAAMKAVGADVPVAWPQDGTAREKSGEVISTLYKKESLRMLPEHATFPAGGYSTEAAIREIEAREATGRFKVAGHLQDFFEERRFYHRKDGLVVHMKDDIMSAVQKGIMMLRHAKPVLLGNKRPDPRQFSGKAKGVDFDLWA